MGYWPQNEEGQSFAEADSGDRLMWGDQPADIIDNALWQIRALFVKDMGRLPTKAEVMAGLTFSTRVGLDDLPATVAEAEAKAERVLSVEDENAYEHEYWIATDGYLPVPPRKRKALNHVRDVIEKMIKS